MKIRFANKKDNFKNIAKLLYGVDPYIYPYWFRNDIEQAIDVLSEIIAEKDSIFYYKNTIVAEVDGELVGYFCFIPANAKVNRNYSKWNTSFEANHVISGYILDVIENLIVDDSGVVGLYVNPTHRRHGIATKMFEFYMNNVVAKTYSLEVLATNGPAINLYNKFNFKTVRAYYGYNGYRRKKPLCYIMRTSFQD